MKLSELLNVLKTAETAEEMDVRREEIAALIPAVRTMFGYDQKNSAHQYDLWMHSLHVVCNLPRRMENDMVYLAALLHDIGKPEAQFRGKREGDPDMHYYGHPEKSMEIVRDVVVPELDRQGYVIPCFDVQELLYYVKYHDDHVSVLFQLALFLLHGDAGPVAHALARTSQGIEERGLAAVRIADHADDMLTHRL